ncbi:MAG: tRNA (5-methylaminomethyl-2-thiouridine)(34)-methyltransferase MnmD, partial [Pseudomonadota bacterium]
PYYALSDGLAESRHVFLDGNRLAERFRTPNVFRIAELGFGTGLNFLAAVNLWADVAHPGAELHFTSFERYPLNRSEIERAVSAWPSLDAAQLIDCWRPGEPVKLGSALLTILVGDARAMVPKWQGGADAWFLDGFAPARNPEMWETELMREIALHTRPGGTFATYTAAGHVRRSLSDAGFVVERRPGYVAKRHMTVGWLPD